jgi:hypothetical protein
MLFWLYTLHLELMQEDPVIDVILTALLLEIPAILSKNNFDSKQMHASSANNNWEDES